MSPTRLSVYARNLPVGKKDDVYATVKMMFENEIDPLELGKTEVIHCERNPTWMTTFATQGHKADSKIVISLFTTDNEAIGSVMFDLDELLAETVMGKDLETSGMIGAYIETITDNATLSFRFQALDLMSHSSSLLHHHHKPDTYFELQRLRQAASDKSHFTYMPVYRSSIVKSSASPVWANDSIKLGILCGKNRSKAFQISIYKHEKKEKDKLMGSVETTLDDMLTAARKGGEIGDSAHSADSSTYFTLRANHSDKVGKLVVLGATVLE